jgi:hypothetical protein
MSYLDIVRRLTEASVPQTPEVAKKEKKVPATRCVECGHQIGPDEPETWWGLDRVHRDCGERAWRREWRGAALPAPALAEH